MITHTHIDYIHDLVQRLQNDPIRDFEPNLIYAKFEYVKSTGSGQMTEAKQVI